ncbi:MAG: lytic transglycosylase domain-containing protein, partial [Planococcaceae bacterium]|nr:lytic transglycosylase domain-containing protein [Planococcaceae bacterium]
MKKKKKTRGMSAGTKGWIILLLLPVTITIYVMAILLWQEMQEIPFVQSLTKTVQEVPLNIVEMEIPEEYISVYKDAAEAYEI